MRVRALVVILCLVTSTVMISGVAWAATEDVDISGEIGAPVDLATDATDALRHIGAGARRFSHDYQWATPYIGLRPETLSTTFSGELGVGTMASGSVATIGLVDIDSLRAGQSGRQEGAFIYVWKRTDGSLRVGVSDGNAGSGELVQRFTTFAAGSVPTELDVTFTVDGRSGVDTAGCASSPADALSADGCMTLTVNGRQVRDSYGTTTAPRFAAEFDGGAVPGWEAWPPGETTDVTYDLTVSLAVVR